MATTDYHDPDALLRDDAAAELLGFTPRALADWRRRGCGPQYVRVSARAIRYRRRDLIAWAASLLRTSTSDDGSTQREAAR